MSKVKDLKLDDAYKEMLNREIGRAIDEGRAMGQADVKIPLDKILSRLDDIYRLLERK